MVLLNHESKKLSLLYKRLLGKNIIGCLGNRQPVQELISFGFHLFGIIYWPIFKIKQNKKNKNQKNNQKEKRKDWNFSFSCFFSIVLKHSFDSSTPAAMPSSLMILNLPSSLYYLHVAPYRFLLSSPQQNIQTQLQDILPQTLPVLHFLLL